MVVALSRFRVANECERAVRDAFLNRPGLVDKSPGFIGMEVFTDTEDVSSFYLITRWTDVNSFRQWHSSPEHKQAHNGIPKGLKLDASFTLVRTLERISGDDGFSSPDGARDSASLISEFLHHSIGVHWLKARSDGVIIACNEAFQKILGTQSPIQLLCVSLWTAGRESRPIDIYSISWIAIGSHLRWPAMSIFNRNGLR